MIQKWVGLGRIGQDAEAIQFPSGNVSLKFSLAIDDSYMSNGEWKDRTYWIPIDVNLPSLVQNYNGRLLKGTLIWVEGKLCTYTYQDPTGTTRTGFKIEAQSLRIIPERKTQQISQPQQSTGNIGYGYQQNTQQNVPPVHNPNVNTQGQNFNPPPQDIVNYQRNVPNQQRQETPNYTQQHTPQQNSGMDPTDGSLLF